MYSVLVFAVFVLVLGLASFLGWSVDSRDGADWKPTDGGLRHP